MYRIVDNKDGSIIALCATEELAKKVLSAWCDKHGDPDLEPEFKRYAYEGLNQHSSYLYPETMVQFFNVVLRECKL